MVQIGAHNEGFLNFPLKKLDNGFVVPDASLSEIHEYHQDQVRNQVEFAVAAEKFGYDYALISENHLNLLAKHTPTPLETQAVVASRTDDIRLLQMANILPWHDPVQLAERIAMLDCISDGRVEAGIGTGSGPREIETFVRSETEESRSRGEEWEAFVEKYEILRRAWTDDVVSYDGEYHEIPPSGVEWEHDQEYHYLADEVSGQDPHGVLSVEDGDTVLESISVFPQPQQEPHPQIWRPAGSEQSVEWAARNGINGCTVCYNVADVKNLVDRYYETAEEAGWPDHREEYDGEPFRYGWDEARNRGIAAQVPIFNTTVASDEAFERWKLGQEFSLSIMKSTRPPEKAAGIPLDIERHMEQFDGPFVGDADEIIDNLATFKTECGYEDFIVFPSVVAPGMTHEDKLEQLEAFAEDVLPYFEDGSAA